MLIVEHVNFGENYALKITHWIRLIYMLSIFMDALFGWIVFKAYKNLIDNAFIQKTKHKFAFNSGIGHKNIKNLLTSFNVPTWKDHRDRLHTGTLRILSFSSTTSSSSSASSSSSIAFFVSHNSLQWILDTTMYYPFGVCRSVCTHIVVRLLIAFYDAVHNL